MKLNLMIIYNSHDIILNDVVLKGCRNIPECFERIVEMEFLRQGDMIINMANVDAIKILKVEKDE